jgi:hypothetical protein
MVCSDTRSAAVVAMGTALYEPEVMGAFTVTAPTPAISKAARIAWDKRYSVMMPTLPCVRFLFGPSEKRKRLAELEETFTDMRAYQ